MTTFLYTLAAVLAQNEAEAPKVFQDQEKVEGDFRKYVWIAYGLVLLLLAAYSIFLMLQSRSVGQRLVHLEERFDHARSKSAAAEGSGSWIKILSLPDSSIP